MNCGTRCINGCNSSAAHTRAAYLRYGGRLQGPNAAAKPSICCLDWRALHHLRGSMAIKTCSDGRRRAYFYGCTSFHKRGKAVRGNSMDAPMLGVKGANTEVLTGHRIGHPAARVIRAALRTGMAKLRPSAEAAQALMKRQRHSG